MLASLQFDITNNYVELIIGSMCFAGIVSVLCVVQLHGIGM